MSVPRIKMIYIILSRVGHTPSSIQLEALNSPRAAELRLLLYIKRFLFQISSVLEGGQMWGVGSRVQLSSPKGFSWSSVPTPPGSASSCRTECSHKRKSPTLSAWAPCASRPVSKRIYIDAEPHRRTCCTSALVVSAALLSWEQAGRQDAEPAHGCLMNSKSEHAHS